MEMDANELYYSAIDESTRRCLRLKWEQFDMEKLWQDDLGILTIKEYEPAIHKGRK